MCCSDGNVPLYVANISSEPCVIRKNTVAAVFEEACDEKSNSVLVVEVTKCKSEQSELTEYLPMWNNFSHNVKPI